MPTRMSATNHASLPAQYAFEWGAPFWKYALRALRPGAVVLDVGAGRRPTIPPERRPPDVHYVGLDISGAELAHAAPTAYDDTVVADAERLDPALVDRFDLIVAWQVLEHFRNLRMAVDSFYDYVRDGGWFVACLSGRYAAHSVANRILPDAVGSRLVSYLKRRPIETVFPAYYDECHERGLRRAYSRWDELHLVPMWGAADYFARLPALRRLYVLYEDWAVAHNFTNLATHYVVAARKRGELDRHEEHPAFMESDVRDDPRGLVSG